MSILSFFETQIRMYLVTNSGLERYRGEIIDQSFLCTLEVDAKHLQWQCISKERNLILPTSNM